MDASKEDSEAFFQTVKWQDFSRQSANLTTFKPLLASAESLKAEWVIDKYSGSMLGILYTWGYGVPCISVKGSFFLPGVIWAKYFRGL